MLCVLHILAVVHAHSFGASPVTVLGMSLEDGWV